MAGYDGLLTGVRVLDLSIWRPGPYCTQLLSDLGADVLKVEPPGGDPMRAFPDLFASLNANKRSVVLDLKDDSDRARAHELVADADAFVEGFRPGVADRLGMGYETVRALNPAIVYCSISGYGQTGPLAEVPGHDLNYQAFAGALAPRGGEPVESALPIADLAGGAFGALGVMGALLGRARTGEGERIDVSMTDVLATWTGPFDHVSLEGQEEEERLEGLPTYGCFETADGRWLTLGVITEPHFQARVCDALGLDEYRDLDTLERIARGAEIREAVTNAIGKRDLADLVAAMEGAPAAPALTRKEMLEFPQFVHRGLVGLRTEDGVGVMDYPVRFEQHAARGPGRPPAAGEHQDEGFGPR